MVKYIDAKTGYSLIKFNKENDEIKVLDSFGTNIDYVWIADEEGMLDNTHVNVGDVIIRMYGNTYKADDRKTLVIKDEQLKNYYKTLKETVDKEREEHKKCCDCECSNCCEKISA